MRHYCRMLIDNSTGEIQHVVSSIEPLPEFGGADPQANHIEVVVVIGAPDDGLPSRRSRHFRTTLQSNPAGVITHRPEVPQNDRPDIVMRQSAINIIEAREIATGRRPAP